MPQLCDLIDLPTYPLVAIVGAGGKTTTMFTLASELAHRGKRVITTTTTQIFYPETGETETLIVAADTPTLLEKIGATWKHFHHVTIAGAFLRTDKLGGLQPEQPYELLTRSGADAVVVEADGARHRMIKAPAEHEPVIPLHTNVALLVMSAEVINQPLSENIAHRPEQIAHVTGIHLGDILSPTVIARLIMSEQGMLKNITKTATVYLLITHCSMDQKEAVQQLVTQVRGSNRIIGVLSSEQPGTWFTV